MRVNNYLNNWICNKINYKFPALSKLTFNKWNHYEMDYDISASFTRIIFGYLGGECCQ